MFWRSQLTVGPWLTEAVGLACQVPQATLQLLVVPGNPGQCSFYCDFMEQLHRVFQGKVDVMAVSHVGHDFDNLTQGKVWCLDSQISHKVQLLRNHILGPDKAPVVVIAHSIGSYIMLQAIKQLEGELTDAAEPALAEALKKQLPKVVLLTPFLAADWSSPRQRVLRMAARAAPVLAAAAAAVGSLPAWVQDRFIPLLQPGTEPHVWDSLKGLMSYSSAHNNFHLARHEFRDLDAPVDWQLIRRLGNRAAVVCAPQDMWFPMEHYEQMCREIPGVEEYWRDDLTHAFCVDTRQCKVVAELVHQSVTSSLPEQLAQQLQVAPGGKQVKQEPPSTESVTEPLGHSCCPGTAQQWDCGRHAARGRA